MGGYWWRCVSWIAMEGGGGNLSQHKRQKRHKFILTNVVKFSLKISATVNMYKY